MRNRRRLRNIEKRTRTLRARLAPQMICEALGHYFLTGELPEDHPELAEVVLALVEVVWVAKAAVPGPLWEEELWGIVTITSLGADEFDLALGVFLEKNPEAAPLLDQGPCRSERQPTG